MDHELAYMPATELAAAIRTRRVSPVEVITALLERIERVKALNREMTLLAVGHLVDELKGGYHDLPKVVDYLDAVQRDVLDHADDFRKQPEAPAAIARLVQRDEPSLRKPAREMLARVGLAGREDVVVSSMSHGEHRQLEIAMALATRPRMQSAAAVQECVATGKDIDLGAFPVQVCWPGEPAPLITWPLVITTPPDSSVTDQDNVGVYRCCADLRNLP